ncbi:MAG TPA: hypothetical protein VKU41_25815 [Polyangiaceae bacterium]|nr:hypothetical protein [Polyangiaceae bacterium]
MHASAPPPQVASEDAGSAAVRFGTAVGIALAAAVACTFPAALRISSAVATLGLVTTWIALSALGVAPMVAAVVVLRGARAGLRTFAGPGAELRAFGVGLWLTLLLVTLSYFGAVLRATTHHHALAGVTFAAGAIVLAVGTALVCVRVVAILRAMAPSTRSVVALAIGGVAALALAWTGLRFLQAVVHDSSSTTAGGTVVDVLAFCLASLFAARPAFATQKPIALVGPPVAVFLAAVGLSMLRDPTLRDAVEERAPAFAPLADLAGGR